MSALRELSGLGDIELSTDDCDDDDKCDSAMRSAGGECNYNNCDFFNMPAHPIDTMSLQAAYSEADIPAPDIRLLLRRRAGIVICDVVGQVGWERLRALRLYRELDHARTVIALRRVGDTGAAAGADMLPTAGAARYALYEVVSGREVLVDAHVLRADARWMLLRAREE